ncbi:nucleotidyltransferase domain-containing protein [Sulfurihydrogenibium subterraneum]|uniref:nucleotidyltransferase domain-containing protein n=1 Tax=Sulfurihydrogenibium subterraneum TaxID=171121 RepID=UPI000490B263|nr:nucleotidyltransferase domain-containing protein [Sulfurihydrogenibium subterraneum]
MNDYFQKKIIEKKDILLDSIKKAYGYNLEAVVLFGSVARGDFARYSDIDVLIIVEDSDLSFRKRINEFYNKVGYYFENHYLSPVILKKEEALNFHPLFLGIFESYITLYDKNGIVDKIVLLIKDKKIKGQIIEFEKPVKYWRILDEA